MAEKEENTIQLKKPLGSGAKSLTFDFDKINGYSLIKAEKLAKQDDPQMVVPMLSQAYQAHVAAMAAGVKYDDILSLCASDFTAVTLRAQRFLAGSQTQAE